MKRKISLIVNGMFYGDPYTRRVLWGVFLLALAVVGLCIAGIAAGIWPFYLLALVCVAFGFILVRRNRLGVSSSEDDEEESEADVKLSEDNEEQSKDDRDHSGEDAEQSGVNVGKSGGSNRLRPSMKDVMDDLEPEKPEYIEDQAGMVNPGFRHSPAIGPELSLREGVPVSESYDKPAAEDRGTFSVRGSDQVPDQQDDTSISLPRTDYGTAEEKPGKDKTQRLTPAEVGDSYSEKTVKKAFHKYKVKRNHRPLLIDHSDTYRIRECPAYGWVQKGTFYLLLLEQEPRRLELPESSISKLYYKRAVPANQRDEYEILGGHNLISAVFSKYRPVYGSVIRRGEQQECKNLYMIKPDIMITAASARELMAIASPELVVEDQIMDSDEYNQYFKQIYKLKIMLDDGVISTKDYPVKVKMILQKLSMAPITPAAFRMTLGDMVRHGLISDEYAKYYAQMKGR